MSDKIFHVLLLSPRNSARSMMAEAILNRIGHPHFIAYSAGIDPAGDLEPETRELFEAMGYPADNLHPKHYRDFSAGDAQKLDFVFALSDTAAGEPLPEWPGLPVSALGLTGPGQGNGRAVGAHAGVLPHNGRTRPPPEDFCQSSAWLARSAQHPEPRRRDRPIKG